MSRALESEVATAVAITVRERQVGVLGAVQFAMIFALLREGR
ncbi:hypothetical protein [Pseudomonas argentinensis]|nr:hypothetical protein [Pseudomonas argentinensis]